MKNYESVTDERLIEELRGGNSEIMDFLMVKYKDMVRKKAKEMYLIGGDNEDLIQEGMIGLMKAVRDYDAAMNSSFRTFAELCVSRQMYSAIQASRRQKHLPLNSYISLYEKGIVQGDEAGLSLIDTIESDVENNPESLYFGKENTQSFIAQLNQELSELERRVLALHLKGENYRDIAKRLDKSPKVIDNALQRIRNKAGKLLK